VCDVTIVSCVYGDRGFDSFIPRWLKAVNDLENPPQDAIVSADTFVSSEQAGWTHPQAFHLQDAITRAETEWVWIVDIDDLPMPDGLNGIEDVTEDVWQMGYLRHPDGHLHIPPQLCCSEILSSPNNSLTAGSAFRRDAFLEVGGFPDVAFQDWGLWRRMARHGMRFLASDRAHYHYNRHPATRTAVELTYNLRNQHLQELADSEAPLVD